MNSNQKKNILTDFDLPKSLIAQYPASPRDSSRLLEVSDTLNDRVFSDILDLVNPGDLLVLNDSKVIKSKINLNKDGVLIGLNLNDEVEKNVWRSFAKPSKKLEVGDEFTFANSTIEIVKKDVDVFVKFHLDPQIESVYEFLSLFGEVPIPPYIRNGIADNFDEEEYQTVYANIEGSVAAPTAGLHFTNELLFALKLKGVDIKFITLHVGAGTFKPITSSIEEHKMHEEFCIIPEDTISAINLCKNTNKRVFSVGTTVTRTLEAYAISGKTEFKNSLFIKPGFEFQIVDCLITNFHLPKSTLLLLCSAFAGNQKVIDAYKHAIDKSYRFFSYGDACLFYAQNSIK